MKVVLSKTVVSWSWAEKGARHMDSGWYLTGTKRPTSVPFLKEPSHRILYTFYRVALFLIFILYAAAYGICICILPNSTWMLLNFFLALL
jgi:hypothetical protein